MFFVYSKNTITLTPINQWGNIPLTKQAEPSRS
jgi:hypothetical protein